MSEDMFGCVFYLILTALFMIGYFIFSPISCSSKFPGMSTDWGPIQGCLVNTSEGWIPAENYRVL